jgi:hypothetical protein
MKVVSWVQNFLPENVSEKWIAVLLMTSEFFRHVLFEKSDLHQASRI